jgi:flagellar basal body P-ring protein FlgI
MQWQKIGCLIAGSIACAVNGCTSPLFRAQSPDTEHVAEAPREEPGVRLVEDYAVPWNTSDLKVEGVGLITQLDGTGSDPPQSKLRDQLLKEMLTHDVKEPNRILESGNTSLVMVRGVIPPGANKGDVVDIEVRVPPRSATTSLNGGWLMQARLREMQLLEGEMHIGHILGTAEGPVVIDALFSGANDEVMLTRGRVLAGGIVSKPRQLGLVIREEHSSVRSAALVGTVINERFNTYTRGAKSGVANPSRDDHVELAVHSRYKHDIERYLRVVGKIAVGETADGRVTRLETLGRMLLEPTNAQDAALQLEAIGPDAVPVLLRGLKSQDREVRFYAAEALAYLDDPSPADALYEAARDVHAFRWRALAALAIMDQYTAQERLAELMNETSAETRYGAFRALRTRNYTDPLVRGEMLGKQMWLHVVNSTGEPLIHCSRSRRPELIVFGRNLRMQPPTYLYAGDKILIKRVDDEHVKMSRFEAGKDTQQVTCTTEVADIVRNIIQLGGSYADVLTALRSAKQRDYLTCRLEMNTLPGQRRVYHRDEALAERGDSASPTDLTHSVPNLFVDLLSQPQDRASESQLDIDPTEAPEPAERGFFARMTSWWSD